MLSGAVRIVKWASLLVGVVALTLLGVLAWNAHRGRPLEPWHTFVPHEMHAKELDKADWAQYLKAEQTIFDEVRTEVTDKLPPQDRVPINRYFAGSPIYPGHFAHDWNRSYIMEPDGPPAGAVVLLHGLTDSPYSLRHIAQRYRAHGFVAVAIRMPGHGTVPAGLTDIDWEDWAAATRLAVREARRRIGPSRPLELVGFSNGGALAMQYALDAIENPRLSRPDRLVLISPMIGITRFARFAGLAALPALLPAFEKAAWLSVVPEFIPFKYNSFPVNGATQSHRLTVALQAQIDRLASQHRLGGLPPILTFQSVIDFTVSTRAIITALYNRLPANGSELVLFDLNRSVKVGPLLRVSFDTTPARLLPPPPRAYRTTVVTNASAGSSDVVERVTEAGATTEQKQDLGLAYPAGVFSLSHLALPFPLSDSLYGLRPEGEPEFGVELGAMAARGERGALIISPDSLMRMTSNPFFPFMIGRIEDGIGTPSH
jgi:alpha-beta hydrolase superfamily lysophospholipase